MSLDPYLKDALDEKVNAHFGGKVVRKDLLHAVKKGTNVPTFVLEFLLARYCASDDPEEISAGQAAVLETLSKHFVHPNQSNRAQSLVEQKGRYKFIDKVSVRFVEKEKRHWAAMQNFDSQRIAINPQIYSQNERLLEGGLWAEVTLGYNAIEEDKYSFFVEELKPIQLSRFDFDQYTQSAARFSRDEWLDLIMRSVGLDPNKMSRRLKFHYIARLAPLVEANYNFIELGPRGTGKSYFYSEYSPYSTLISGGQTSPAELFYNNSRRKLGKVGFWDVIAFDEIGNVRIKDPDTIQIMKDFMANGRFTRGAEVTANASFCFIGNMDESVEQIANSTHFDLFLPLPPQLDLAIQDRFCCYLPGWEIPKNSSEYLSGRYGFITDYLAEAFHHLHRFSNRYEEVHRRVKLGSSVQGRDEKAIKKTLCAFLKILHPMGAPTDGEFEEYVAYAVESRRRIKEQMNKRKPDDEFARIDLSYFTSQGEEIVVWCPESRNAVATQRPNRRVLDAEKGKTEANKAKRKASVDFPVVEQQNVLSGTDASPSERHFTIFYDDKGYTYDSIIGPYLDGVTDVSIDDPYIRMEHQVRNFTRFCECLVQSGKVKKIRLSTGFDDEQQKAKAISMFDDLKESLLERDIALIVEFNPQLHDREIRLNNGWVVKIGRGLDFYQRPNNWFELGSHDLAQRKCLETKVDIFRKRIP